MSQVRKINGLTFSVKTRLMKVSAISKSTEFQYREDKQVDIRAREIARSVRNSEATRYRDNPILFERHRRGCAPEYLVVDGFGRIAAWELLGRDEIEVDVLVGSSDNEKSAHTIACVINTNNVSERGFKDSELPRATAKLRELKFSAKKIASMHGVTEATVYRRIKKYHRDLENAKKKRSEIQPIEGGRTAAKALVTKVVGNATGETFREFTDAQNYLSAAGITLRVLTMANDEPKTLAFDALQKMAAGEHARFLVFLYLRTHDDSDASCKAVTEALRGDVGQGLRAAAKYFSVPEPAIEFVSLSNNEKMVNYLSLTSWIENHASTMKLAVA